jgi:sugar-specific transcriptional regulator TrmB
VRALSVAPQDILDSVLWLAIAMPDGFSPVDVAAHCGLPRNHVYRAMLRLKKDGVIDITWRGKGCIWTTAARIESLRQKMKAHYKARHRESVKRKSTNYAKRQSERIIEPAPTTNAVRWVFDLA